MSQRDGFRCTGIDVLLLLMNLSDKSFLFVMKVVHLMVPSQRVTRENC